jgi:hypothetical protein
MAGSRQKNAKGLKTIWLWSVRRQPAIQAADRARLWLDPDGGSRIRNHQQ